VITRKRRQKYFIIVRGSSKHTLASVRRLLKAWNVSTTKVNTLCERGETRIILNGQN
jgi:hypothetical protein